MKNVFIEKKVMTKELFFPVSIKVFEIFLQIAYFWLEFVYINVSGCLCLTERNKLYDRVKK